MATRKLRCDFCGKLGARVQRATHVYGRGAGEFLVRNIPTIRCSQCGERYITSVTLRELERIKAQHGRLAVKRRIPVADFSTATKRRAS
jgi:YgiT-type zinc finger domain-containing protein